MSSTFLGYMRDDGRIGVRDHVLILPLTTTLVPVAAEIAKRVEGIAVTHEFEAAANENELRRVTRTFVGTAEHPNVNVCVALGDSSVEPHLVKAVAALERVELIDAALMPSRRRIVDAGSALARERFTPATRQPIALSRLILGTECGGSDGWSGITANPALGHAADWLVDHGGTVVLAETPELIGAEHLLAQRADVHLAAAVVEIVLRYERALAAIGEDIRGAQPTVGNMAGGLTTIEEKSLGAAKKAGSRPIKAIVEYAEPIPECGSVVLMDTPGHDIEQMTGMVAGGCQIAVFTTGRGTPTGSAVAPVLKVATNSETYVRLNGDIDLDAGGILTGRTIEDVAQDISETITRVASGELTSAERRRATDFALSRFAPWEEVA
jgi:altronate dehydratase large subunit